MSQYRDSSYQYQHFIHPYYALYNEWMDDEELPPPDDMLGGSNQNGSTIATDTTTNTHNTNTTTNNNTVEAVEGNGVINDTDATLSNAATNGTSLNTQYWDFFDDEENWEIFNKFNLQVESNGRITYNHIVGRDVNSQDNSDGANMNPDGPNNTNGDNQGGHPTEDNKSISGSLFDARVLTKIRNRVNGWNDLGEPFV